MFDDYNYIFSYKDLVLKFYFLQALFQAAQHLYDKGEGSGFVPMTYGPYPRSLKTVLDTVKKRYFMLRVHEALHEEDKKIQFSYLSYFFSYLHALSCSKRSSFCLFVSVGLNLLGFIDH
jgi:hypothetical protein